MKNQVHGLRIFLYVILSLIKNGNEEKCSYIENEINNEIATKLYQKYTNYFEKYDFNKRNLKEINDYYKNFHGIADGNEERKYDCESNDGLYLLIKLALNDIF